MDLTPALVLAMWAAGLAAAGAAVASWRIVGPGYAWMAAGVVVLLGVFVTASGGGVLGAIGVVTALAAAVLARNGRLAATAFGLAALAFGAVATIDSPLGWVVSGVLFTGGVTSEMLLGHWYLVDPRLPRWALYRLAYAGGAGLIVEAALVGFRVAGNGVASDAVFGWAYLALAVMTALLIVGVWFSLKEPRYTGVMSATGLSYLAVLTALGVLVVGRLVAYG